MTRRLATLPPGSTGVASAGAGMSVPEEVRSNAAILARLGVDELWIIAIIGRSEGDGKCSHHGMYFCC